MVYGPLGIPTVFLEGVHGGFSFNVSYFPPFPDSEKPYGKYERYAILDYITKLSIMEKQILENVFWPRILFQVFFIQLHKNYVFSIQYFEIYLLKEKKWWKGKYN